MEMLIIIVPGLPIPGRIHLRKFFRTLKTDQYFLIISVDNPFSTDKIRAIASSLGNDKKQVQWKFSITSEREYEQAAEIIEELKLENTEIVPVYRGHNIRFLKITFICQKKIYNTPV
jgi:hypothetical protein